MNNPTDFKYLVKDESGKIIAGAASLTGMQNFWDSRLAENYTVVEEFGDKRVGIVYVVREIK